MIVLADARCGSPETPHLLRPFSSSIFVCRAECYRGLPRTDG